MTSTRPASAAADAPATSISVLIIETMCPSDPTLVFDTDRTREFSPLSRLQNHRDPRLTKALHLLVDDVVRTREPADRAIELRDGRYLAAYAAPRLGPDPEVVFAVQVVLAQPDKVPTQLPVRTVGTLEWSSETKQYHHDPVIETEIMGVDNPKAERSALEIYKMFQSMPKFGDLGNWASDFMSDPQEMDGAKFSADLLMQQVDSETKLKTFMTFRAVAQVKGIPVIRGLVHEIGDIAQPQPEIAFNHRLLRNAFGSVDLDPNSGYGVVNSPTNFIYEWYQDPPEPLSRWSTQDAVLDEHNQAVFEQLVAEVAGGTVKSASRRIAVRFEGTGPILVSTTISAGMSGKLGQVFMKVTPLEPAPGDNPPPADLNGGILSW